MRKCLGLRENKVDSHDQRRGFDDQDGTRVRLIGDEWTKERSSWLRAQQKGVHVCDYGLGSSKNGLYFSYFFLNFSLGDFKGKK